MQERKQRLSIMGSLQMKDSNREAFEAYMAEKYKNLMDRRQCLNNGGGYMAWDMNVAWKVWQAAIAQAVQEWISVEDELPTPNKTFSDAVIAWDGLCIRRIPLCLFNSTSEVTHWMPIPQPPKAQEQAND